MFIIPAKKAGTDNYLAYYRSIFFLNISVFVAAFTNTAVKIKIIARRIKTGTIPLRTIADTTKPCSCCRQCSGSAATSGNPRLRDDAWCYHPHQQVFVFSALVHSSVYLFAIKTRPCIRVSLPYILRELVLFTSNVYFSSPAGC